MRNYLPRSNNLIIHMLERTGKPGNEFMKQIYSNVRVMVATEIASQIYTPSGDINGCAPLCRVTGKTVEI